MICFVFVCICSVRATIDRYKKHHADSTSTGSVSEANTQVNLFI